ncbi:MAG: SdpI family protein, partial [Bacilli bacterium]|nr:SdpI family protein [Bacilli bacterium]
MNPVIIVSFCVSGIFITSLLLVLMIIFKAKDIDENYLFGYRTNLSLSSPEAWEWCNGLFCKAAFIGCPFLLVGQAAILTLSLLLPWPYWPSIVALSAPAIFVL